MTTHSILLIGGSGIVGRHAARFLRDMHPDVPLLIAGRDQERAERAASELGRAESIVLDTGADDLGLGDRAVAAVATLFTDASGRALRWAQRQGAGHISISPGIIELGPEVASFVHAPSAAPVVLGTEWLVGATSVSTIILSQAFGRVDTIRIGALLDEQDDFGPAAKADLERQTRTTPIALVRRDGSWTWCNGDDAEARIRAVDSTEVAASAFSPNDVLALAEVTGARDIRFDLALGTSSTRRAGEPLSTEILIDLTGTNHAGQPLRTRHAVIHPGGQMPLTGLGVALVLERLSGLAGKPPAADLYFPSQLIDPATYLDRLADSGGRIMELEPSRHA